MAVGGLNAGAPPPAAMDAFLPNRKAPALLPGYRGCASSFSPV